MNRNDQNNLNKVYTEAVLQGVSDNEPLQDSSIAEIKAKLGASEGMPLEEFVKAVGSVLGADIRFWNRNDKQYVFADFSEDDDDSLFPGETGFDYEEHNK